MKKKLAFFLHFIASSFAFFRPAENHTSSNLILFINEDTSYSKLTHRLLAINGFKIFEVHTFRSARAQLIKGNATMILMEENLADGTAMEFLEKNKSLFVHKNIVVISTDLSGKLKNDLDIPGGHETLPNSFQAADLNKILYKLSIFNNTS
jgi:DNA-binding NtrC family response regulator